MEHVDVRPVEPVQGQGLQISVESQVSALSDRYAARGLRKSVLENAAEQIRREEETRGLAPEAYRLSLMSEASVNGRYRLGKHEMNSSDLVRYFADTRERRIRNVDFSENTGADVCKPVTENESDKQVSESRALVLPEKVKALSGSVSTRLKAAVPTWFNAAKPDTSREIKRFPLSAFAAVAAVAMSMMLIVASSVLLTRAENNISSLKKQINSASSEVAELKSDLEVQYDLLEIRRIAMEEYGMVDEEYIKMHYLTLGNEDNVEAFEDDREDQVGLSAILSGILQ